MVHNTPLITFSQSIATMLPIVQHAMTTQFSSINSFNE